MEIFALSLEKISAYLGEYAQGQEKVGSKLALILYLTWVLVFDYASEAAHENEGTQTPRSRR